MFPKKAYIVSGIYKSNLCYNRKKSLFTINAAVVLKYDWKSEMILLRSYV